MRDNSFVMIALQRMISLFLFSILICIPALATPKGATSVSSDRIFKYNGFVCAYLNDKWVPARVVKGYTVQSLKNYISEMGTKAKTARSDKIKTKYTNRKKAAKVEQSAALSTCVLAPSPVTTPKPTTGTVFDSSGNFTESGADKYGIPTNLTSCNMNEGSKIQTTECLGCHGDRGSGMSFSALKNTIQNSPMFITHLNDAQICDALAYLNRFDTR